MLFESQNGVHVGFVKAWEVSVFVDLATSVSGSFEVETSNLKGSCEVSLVALHN